MKKFGIEVKPVNNVLDSQRNHLQKEINNQQELKNRKYDLDDLYQKYITEYELTKDGKQKIEKSRGKNNNW